MPKYIRFLWSIARRFNYNWASHELNLDVNIHHWARHSYSHKVTDHSTKPRHKAAEKNFKYTLHISNLYWRRPMPSMNRHRRHKWIFLAIWIFTAPTKRWNTAQFLTAWLIWPGEWRRAFCWSWSRWGSTTGCTRCLRLGSGCLARLWASWISDIWGIPNMFFLIKLIWVQTSFQPRLSPGNSYLISLAHPTLCCDNCQALIQVQV